MKIQENKFMQILEKKNCIAMKVLYSFLKHHRIYSCINAKIFNVILLKKLKGIDKEMHMLKYIYSLN